MHYLIVIRNNTLSSLRAFHSHEAAAVAARERIQQQLHREMTPSERDDFFDNDEFYYEDDDYNHYAFGVYYSFGGYQVD